MIEMINEAVDVRETGLWERCPQLLEILLQDMTTGGTLLWATDDYAALGEGYGADDCITVEKITGEHEGIIKPWIKRSKEIQQQRIKKKGEVFTPARVCNMQINAVDDEWIGRTGSFNTETAAGWLTSEGKVEFPKEKDTLHPTAWQKYVELRRMEITCGEAPYITSRYDAATCEAVPLKERVGLLDRKLRVIAEHVRSRADAMWFKWAEKALKSVYGYDWQGDNVLLARENILFTMLEAYEAKFGKEMTDEQAEKFARIIAWNIWQMDGLKYVIPRSCHEELIREENLFGGVTEERRECPGCKSGDSSRHNGIAVRINTWYRNKEIEVRELTKGAVMMAKNKEFKFDVIIGNPPYQEETLGDNKTFAPPVYHLFMDEAVKVAEKVELIHPARFLFNGGATPKAWNKKMLNDEHFKVIYYEQDSRKFFRDTEIKGGVAITYRDRNKNFGKIDTFTSFSELNSILHKVVVENKDFDSFSKIVYAPESFKMTDSLHNDFPAAINLLSKGHKYDLKSSVFDRLSALPIFLKEKPADKADYVKILGLLNGKRELLFVKAAYIQNKHNIDKYKVILPEANGNGKLGDTFSTPLIGEPYIGTTQTFITIGAFATEQEAEAALKYIKTKFARAMLGVLKITQHNPASVWAKVPLQDFTAGSDIDWSKPVAEIDRQLYAKYGLSEAEIAFIESKVRAME